MKRGHSDYVGIEHRHMHK